MLRRLIPGFILIPVFFLFYTAAALPRARCHIPSFSFYNWHILFELIPYFFVFVSIFLFFKVAKQAIVHSSNISANIAAISLAFEFGVFTFAIAYYQYGLLLEPNEVSSILTAIFYGSGMDLPMTVGSSTIAVSEDGYFIVSPSIAATSLDYLFFSLSVAFGDSNLSGMSLCESGKWLILLQDIVNKAFQLLAVVVFARFELQSIR